MQVAAVVLAFLMLVLNYDLAYAGVIAWSLFAISVKQSDSQSVKIAALILGGIVSAGFLICLLVEGRRRLFYSATPKLSRRNQSSTEEVSGIPYESS
eukprot:NODE_6794_length_434_cov_145.561039_g5197_i0.p1 GENE.NODE_6794_length_434_cov_145.561039_g5197_i0~~NODE_6794_length_434_cov_145.561039_g5197_i0.p1  ORF type:complete len:97 (-),score=11.78 NODE_6794_length_434_cov_145.561039_g5197_i0:80-370(-)